MAELSTPQPARHPAPTAKATRLAYLVFERPDIERAKVFLEDFGLITAQQSADTVYLRAAEAAPFCYVLRQGEEARFAGLAFDVEARSDLEKLSRIAGASPIEKLATPGGGEVVRLRDPSGFAVEVVLGREAYAELPVRRALEANSASSTPRVNRGQRTPVEPPEVIRLGHVVLELADFQATCAWYTQHLGLIPSDVQVLSDGSPAVTFLRLDRGDTPSDHHTLALAQGFAARYNHSAYEVADLDAVGMGQRVLRKKGYTHAWGIGRHLLGSQIFDYWQDPWDAKHEHYADGDVFTSDVPIGVSSAGGEGLSQWGPPLPATFLRPAATLTNLGDAIRNTVQSPDLSLRKLLEMAKL